MAYVAIDAGHGSFGVTPGKRTPAGEYEWEFNNKVAKAAIAKLKASGVKILRTDDPTGKTDVPLKVRTNKANAAKVDLFVSFHHNANTGKWGNWTGTETYVYTSKPKNSVKLAKAVHSKQVKAYGLKDRGIRYKDLHVLRETNMAAILVEGGFMDSTIDIKKLRNDKVLKKAGEAIADGIMSYLGVKPKKVKKPAKSKNVHVVAKGDTLWDLSKKYKISVASLKSMNGLKSDLLKVGQKLKLNKKVTHKVVKGDTLWSISLKYNVTVNSIKSANNLKSNLLKVGKKLVIPSK